MLLPLLLLQAATALGFAGTTPRAIALASSRTARLPTPVCRYSYPKDEAEPAPPSMPERPHCKLLRAGRGVCRDVFDTLTSSLVEAFDERMKRHRHALRPKRIILVRHGLSEGNVNRTRYTHKPDSQIELTERGFTQGKAAGQQIRTLIGDESVRFFYSPYLRTTQTLLAILEAFPGRELLTTSEPRLRAQDHGHFQDTALMETVYRERQIFGRFYYRFPDGEAGTDVYDRVCDLWANLYAFMERTRSRADRVENYVLVTHGLLMRIFCMCYFRWTIAEFEQVWNPSNGEIWVLEKDGANGYRHLGRWRASPVGGSMTPLAFGKDKRQALHGHMRRPVQARRVRPNDPERFSSPALAHLQVPGPKHASTPRERQTAREEEQRKEQRAMLS